VDELDEVTITALRPRAGLSPGTVVGLAWILLAVVLALNLRK
jgi:hypothetical protein